MENRVSITIGDRSGSPVIVWANRYQFGRSERVANVGVESRALLWGVAGSGEVQSGGSRLQMRAGEFMMLPWRHDVEYLADRNDPFLVGAVHLVPWHDEAVEVDPHAAHGASDPLAGISCRQDVGWPGGSQPAVGGGAAAENLLRLANFVVEHFLHGSPDETTLRALAVVFIHEITVLERTPGGGAPSDMPRALLRMEEYVLSHLASPLSVGDICAAGNCSASTAERLFRRHSDLSVREWVIHTRMAAAAELLRTSNKSVKEVSRLVGYVDPLYFSKAFRKLFGIPPSSYASESRLT